MFDPLVISFGAKMLFNTVKLKPGAQALEQQQQAGEQVRSYGCRSRQLEHDHGKHAKTGQQEQAAPQENRCGEGLHMHEIKLVGRDQQDSPDEAAQPTYTPLKAADPDQAQSRSLLIHLHF